jgi:hypothetical protein
MAARVSVGSVGTVGGSLSAASVVGMERYRKVEKNGSLGSGAYGVVYKAIDIVTQRFVALKVDSFPAALSTCAHFRVYIRRKSSWRRRMKVYRQQR